MISSPLTLLIFLPFVGALLQGLPLGRVASRRIAISSSALCLGLSAWCLFVGMDSTVGGMQFVERVAWMPDFGIGWLVGADGFSLALLFLSSLIFFVA